MALNIATLVKDPEFQSLPVSDKRSLLSEGDPEFSSLTDEEIIEFSKTNTSPSIQKDLSVVPESFRKEQVALNEPSIAGFGRRLQNQVSEGSQVVGGLLDMVPKGLEEALKLAQQSTTSPGDTLGSLLKTALEAGTRIGGDPVNMLASKLEEYRNNPSSIPGDLARTLVAPIPGASALIPKSTSESSLESMLQSSQLSEELGKERSKGYSSNLIPQGQVQSNLSDLALLASPIGSKGVRAGVRSAPLVGGLEGAIRGGAGMIGGTTKSIVKSFLPKSVKSEFVTALNPGSNPVQVQRATNAAETVLPNIDDVIERSGSDFSSAAGARDVSNFAKNDIWSGIEAKTGQPLLVDASAIGDAYYSISTDPVVIRMFPEVIPQLEAEAAKYIGQKIPVQELEQIKQTFNAINNTKEAITKSKKAALLKSDPVYAASNLANEAIGAVLEDTFGPDFTAQKKQWGAWKEINDLANKQAIRQDIINNKITPYEGLGLLGAIAQGVAEEGGLIKGASTALAGKALKYTNSPDAKFSNLNRKLSQSK